MNEKLRTARDEASFTQVELAYRAKISEVSYQRIEYGIQRPSLITAIYIAEALNITTFEDFRDLFAPVPDSTLSPEA